jgi:anti-sigma-K factor RskA
MTEPEHDDQELLAAEYVLGTLDPEERARARALCAMDSGFAALVAAWERRLGELHVLVAPIEPPPEIRDRIGEAIAAAAFSGEARAAAGELAASPEEAGRPAVEAPGFPEETRPLPIEPSAVAEQTRAPAVEPPVLPETPRAPDVELPPEPPNREFAPTPVVDVPRREENRAAVSGREVGSDREVLRLRRRVRRWRKIAAVLLLLVAAGVGIGYVREVRPEYLQYLPPDLRPADLRPKAAAAEVTGTIEIPSPKPAQFVAVLQKDGVQPAFLLSFDLERRTLMARNVSAPAQAGKNYQLWLISGRFPAPRSLGVIGTQEYARPELAGYDSVTLHSATYGVSLEPAGGSKTGSPSGPMLYSGKLVQVSPVGFRDQTP